MFKIAYYLKTSYRRKLLDEIQEKYRHLYNGVVLDIGGRTRGRFVKPKNHVKRWIFADIEKDHGPDMVLDVANMKQVKSSSIDTVNAMELFEHVENILEGLNECYRVLKKGGVLLVAVPFLFPLHADPYDFQRWTDEKWKRELDKIGFKTRKFEIMGSFFTVMGDMILAFIKSLPHILKYPCYLFYPIVDLVVRLDNTNFVQNNKVLSKYHGGYFIILEK